jgi:hypothetical protein
MKGLCNMKRFVNRSGRDLVIYADSQMTNTIPHLIHRQYPIAPGDTFDSII